jgi:hypothetical protein
MPYSTNHTTLFYPLYSCSIFCLLYSHSTSRWVYSLAHRRSSHYTPCSFYSVSCSYLKNFIALFYCYSFILPSIQVMIYKERNQFEIVEILNLPIKFAGPSSRTV